MPLPLPPRLSEHAKQGADDTDQQQTQRIPQRIDGRVNLRTQPPLGWSMASMFCVVCLPRHADEPHDAAIDNQAAPLQARSVDLQPCMGAQSSLESTQKMCG